MTQLIASHTVAEGDTFVCRRRRLRQSYSSSGSASAAIGPIVAILLLLSHQGEAFLHSQESCLRRVSLRYMVSSSQRIRSNKSVVLRNRLQATSIDYDDGSQSRLIQEDVSDMQALRQKIWDLEQQTHMLIKANDLQGALEGIQRLLEVIRVSSANAATASDNTMMRYMSQCLDRSVQTFAARTFNVKMESPSRARKHVMMGVEAIQLQLSSQFLSEPYNLLPKMTFLNALKALTQLIEVGRGEQHDPLLSNMSAAAFRILQRLVTGVGIRNKSSPLVVYEKDFCMVLNAFTESGRMDMAHRIIALQERTEHAPPLSPVAFSILLKGYGRLKDLQQVEMVLQHSERSKITPDTVMFNSLIDAYVNCNAIDKARGVFDRMQRPQDTLKDASATSFTCPPPNKRTYNTMLKGYANLGMLGAALELCEQMRRRHMCDAVTTNTLVHAAVVAGDFGMAERVLSEQTERQPKEAGSQHPNVEAYTELLDAYAKSEQLDKAVSILPLMQSRGVEANDYTYTCLIAGFGRAKRMEEAKKMMAYMRKIGMQPSVITYNALISAVLELEASNDDLDRWVDLGLKILREMIHAQVRPNAVTVSALVEALGRCDEPRVKEACTLVSKLEKERIISKGTPRVVTALVQTCGVGGDIKASLEAFRTLRKPDTIAVNAFLDACYRCCQDRLALETFKYYFHKRNGQAKLKPDVVSFSTLISALLKKNTSDSRGSALHLYNEMQLKALIKPDNALVDIVLKALLKTAQTNWLTDSDVRFVANVLRDAENLGWADGQLYRRKRAVRAVLADRLRETFNQDDDLYRLVSPDVGVDELFQKHGWNQVDSGFRLWGRNNDVADGEGVDKFLQSKGWNNVDSGFRIF